MATDELTLCIVLCICFIFVHRKTFLLTSKLYIMLKQRLLLLLLLCIILHKYV